MQLTLTNRIWLTALLLVLAASLIAPPRITGTTYYVKYLWLWEDSYGKVDFTRIGIQWILTLLLFAVSRLLASIKPMISRQRLRSYATTAIVSSIFAALYTILEWYGEPLTLLTPDQFMQSIK